VRTLDDLDLDLTGRRVLLRADLNVSLEHPAGEPVRVVDDARIRAAGPTIEELRGRGAAIVLVSHLGRPRDREPELSMRPVAERLRELFDAPLAWAGAVVGPSVQALADGLRPGEVLVLENVRYERGETANDPALARALAALAHVYVDDAFGSAHRAHASTEGVAHLLPSAAGRLLQREVEVLVALRDDPARPLVAVLGGAKVADKIELVGRFLERADAVLIGGAMSFPFLAAEGHATGASLCDPEDIPRARDILQRAAREQRRLCLPEDLVVARGLDAEGDPRTLADVEVPAGWMGLDIGPRTAERYAREIEAAAMVFWNGPMGAFEHAPLDAGTRAVAQALAHNDGTTIVGGGETVEALRSFGLQDRVSHISTGGGATLELLSGRTLPGVRALDEPAAGS
jgi:phosphoglycerate kinase